MTSSLARIEADTGAEDYDQDQINLKEESHRAPTIARREWVIGRTSRSNFSENLFRGALAAGDGAVDGAVVTGSVGSFSGEK